MNYDRTHRPELWRGTTKSVAHTLFTRLVCLEQCDKISLPNFATNSPGVRAALLPSRTMPRLRSALSNLMASFCWGRVVTGEMARDEPRALPCREQRTTGKDALTIGRVVGTGWGRGAKHSQSESNPVLLPYHSAHWSFATSYFATALEMGKNIFPNR